MKAFIHGIVSLSLTFSQTTLAATAPVQVEPMNAMKELIKRSGIGKKGAKLKDVYEATKDRLPLDFRYEIERFMYLYPNVQMPQIDIRGVKNGQFDDLQMSFVEGKQSFTLLISLRGDDVGTITYSLNGKNISRKVTMADLVDPVSLMTSVLGSNQSVTRQFAFARLLYSSEIAELKPEQQKAYMKTLQETVASMYQVQSGFVSIYGKKKTSFWQRLVGDNANASDFQLRGRKCISRGGWVGEFTDENGNCQAPPEAFKTRDSTSIKAEICNPAVYGGTYDFKYEFTKIDGLNGPGHCREKTKDTFLPVFKWAPADQLDSEYKRVNDQLNALSELCATDDAVKDKQIIHCRQLDEHAEAIRRANQAMYLARKGPGATAPSTVAGPAVTTAAAPATAPADGPRREQPEDERAGPGSRERARPVAATGACQGLPDRADDLQCGNGNAQSITCNTASGPIRKWYCVCEPRSQQIRASGGKTIECRAGSYGRYDRDERGPRGIREPVGEKPWYDGAWSFVKKNWAPLLALTGVVVGGMLMIKANESSNLEQINQYYAMNAPSTPTFAPPAVTTLPAIGVGPGGQTFPSIPGRPAPGGMVQPTGGYTFPAYTGVPGAPANGVLKRGIRNSTTIGI